MRAEIRGKTAALCAAGSLLADEADALESSLKTAPLLFV